MSRDLLEVGKPWFVQGEDGGLWPLNKHSNAYEKSLVVKTGAGKLYGFTVYNSGAAQFIQLHDDRSVPGTGAVPCLVFPIGATSAAFIGFGDTGRTFGAGCVLANSSTGPTLTLGAADCFFDAQYL